MKAARSAPLMDLQRLNRRSIGDPRLKLELLALFCLEAERLLTQLATASDPQRRRGRLHAIVAAAANVGAMRLAAAARRAEPQATEDEPDLHELTEALRETLSFIRGSAL